MSTKRFYKRLYTDIGNAHYSLQIVASCDQ